MTLLALGLVLCHWEYGAQFWGNWMHTRSFNLGIAFISVSMGAFVGTSRSRFADLLSTIILLLLAVALLWTYPGWLLLHTVISKLLE
jgi:hypothetical protein